MKPAKDEMPKSPPKAFFAPVLIIIVGAAWLLAEMKLIPTIEWLWTICLAAAGFAVILFGGLTKLTLVAGPFLLIASACSALRHTGRLALEYEVPFLVLALGVLLLLAELTNLPVTKAPSAKNE